MTLVQRQDYQRTAADPALSAFVTANAGSGKTKTLVDRVARLLLKQVAPEAILCVTYTKAAAAEMQSRLFGTLGEWAVLPDDPSPTTAEGLRQKLAKLEGRPDDSYDAEELSRARALFARALETPGGLKIQTLHAFCEKLLRRFPLEAGVSPNFQVMDDASAAAIASVARDRVAQAAACGAPVVADAYARFAVALAFDDFERMFATFEFRREAIAAYVERCGGLAGLPGAVAKACDFEDGVIPDAGRVEEAAVLPPALDPAAWFAAAAGLAQGTEKSDQPKGLRFQAVAEAALRGEPSLAEVRSLFFTGDGGPRKTLATKAVPPAVCEWLSNEQERLVAAFDQARAARVAEDTVYALSLGWIYAEQYRRAKAERGALDFADLVARADELLTKRADAAWVLYKLDGGIEHVLVDEAQDTAPEQWRIVRAVTDEFFAGSGVREGAERTVFVVGDEKQSIFSFQGAAPERLLDERQHYERVTREALAPFVDVPLRESWRSTPQVLSFVDAVFSTPELQRALQPRRDGTDAGLDEVVEHIAARTDGPGTIELWPLERETESEDRRAWDEPLDLQSRGSAYKRLAENIAAEIRRIVETGEGVWCKDTRRRRPASFGDMLILVRKRSALFEEILRALKRAGVPVAGADRLVLSETAAFEDLLALARFCLFPHDDLTLAALLRSPFCDLDEDSLFALAHGRDGSLWAALARRAQERPEWADARGFLGWARGEAGARSPFDFYGRTLSRLDRDGRTQRARLLCRLGPEAEDAVDEFLAQVLAAEERGVRDLETLAHELARLNVTVKREMDAPRGEVRVMTAHGSKGLEAPIVFLPETVTAGAVRGSPLMETDDGGFLWCGPEGDDCAASAFARTQRKRREEDEALRLLYVGLTRARDRLVVAGRIGAKAKEENLKGWWPHVRAAFGHERLNRPDDPHRVREVLLGDRTVRRYGADPEPLARSAEVASAPPPPPEWALRPAPKEAGRAWASPSSLAEGAVARAASPLAERGGLGRFRRGALIHKLFEVLPDVAPERRTAAADKLLDREHGLTPEQRGEIAAAVSAVLEDARFAEVFAPGSRAEVAVAGGAPDLPTGVAVTGRIDRLVVTPSRVLVVDYKTNRPAPERAEDADPAYLAQMAVYVAVLRAVYPGREVSAALLWTDGPKLTALSDVLVERTLARLRDG